ncbi:MAG: sporulation membrane protein YtaF [Desulfotomaculum sp.]|nr:sporulation membrane protein YtaF [Desulfotomaculum sp.]
MELIAIIIFALALNMDAFGTGIAYGIRRIKIPFNSVLIISLMSVIAISISMIAGHLLTGILSESLARQLGGILLIILGIWLLIQCRPNSKNGTAKQHQKEKLQKTVLKLRLKMLGLVIQVLREPVKADLDKSGVISSREALLLGYALALDAFGAGFAVAMIGFNLIITVVVVGLGHILMIYSGLILGSRFIATNIGPKMAVIPGLILIIIGIFKLISVQLSAIS